MLLNAILAAVLISILSFAGALTLVLKKDYIKKIVVFLVALSAGTMIGGAFLHLIPESLNEFQDSKNVFILLILGFCIFFILERIIRWRHCHHNVCDVHPFGMMNLVGDGVHNFFDGMILVAAFVSDLHLGIVTTLAIIFHEIPQEIGDFGVLLHAGYSAKKALFYNFLSALLAVFGVIIGFYLGDKIENFSAFLVPIAAGGFLHIAASDLIPELHKEKDTKKAIWSFVIFVLGIVIMWSLGLINTDIH